MLIESVRKSLATFIVIISVILILTVCGCMSSGSTEKHAFTVLQETSTPQQSKEASLEYLRKVMDQYHYRFPVYDDVSSPGNHFFAFAKIPFDISALHVNGSFTTNRHSGATSIRFELGNTTEANFGGFYLLNGVLPDGVRAPQLNFGTIPNAGVDLTGATALTFWARGERGNEKIDFFMGGVGYNPSTGIPDQPFPDSTPVVKISVTLGTQWQQYRIDLIGKKLDYILGGFGWVASLRGDPNIGRNNPEGVVFYVDEIQYELNPTRRDQRLNEPRFLRSFTTLDVQSDPFDANKDDDIDFVLRNTAFTYDNALAILSFLADGTADSLRRADLIGKAFVYAARHDRSDNINGDRLRSAYAAGDITLPPGWTPKDKIATVPVPGFYVEEKQEFFETKESATIDTGNNAWVMIALLALYKQTGNQDYLDVARALGNFINTLRDDTDRYKGFQAGFENVEDSSSRRSYASTEHNLDVNAAFTLMFQITGEQIWQGGAQHAREFVEQMWKPEIGCYLAGTKDPDTRNEDTEAPIFQLPLDVQAWSVLSLPDVFSLHSGVLDCAELNHRAITTDGLSGYDFNNDKDGVWFEGTGQMATAYAFTDKSTVAENLRQTLRLAQQTPSYGDGEGVVAASKDGLTTGFDFKYFRRFHVAATSWNIFAQLGFNPYYQRVAFDAIAPAVRVISPNGGEKLKAGESFTISWESSDNEAVISQQILLSTDSGATFPETVATGLAGNAHSFLWRIPGKATTQARIRIIALDAANNQNDDISDNNFGIDIGSIPKITSFVPSIGAVGTSVTITGTDLSNATDVMFNGKSVTGPIISVPPSSIRVTVPNGATTGKITVTNLTGTSPPSTGTFRVLPKIDSFTPASGIAGESVSITGTTLKNPTIVKFATATATVVSSSDTQIVAAIPPAAITGRISVTTADGTAVSPTNFTVIKPPMISLFTPASGAIGAIVTISGANMSSVTNVQFNGTGITDPITVVSATAIRVKVPGGATTGKITVTNRAGIATSTGIFKVLPKITGFVPTSGIAGENVTIIGTTLSNPTLVKFGAVTAAIVSSSDTEIVTTIPLQAITGRISVTTASGTVVSAANFTVIRPPTVSSFTPASAAIGATVTISGANISSAIDVQFNGIGITDPIAVISATSIRVKVPEGATTGKICVTNRAGNACSTGIFKVLPKITNFIPGSALPGETVAITGFNFTGATVVRFGAVASTNFSVDSDTQITAQVPATAITGKVSVTTLSGVGISAVNFTVIRPPTISSFTPANGRVGVLVTISGANLSSITEVKFNGISAGTPQAISPTAIRVAVPAGATTGKITVVNRAGTFTSAGTFTVIP
jgi:hypothetical protein